jgi:hypothetical protein
MTEQHPEAASLEDFRPGAIMISRHDNGVRQHEETFKVTSFPYVHEGDAFDDLIGLKGSIWADVLIFCADGIKYKDSISLSDKGVLPNHDGRYNGWNVAILQKPATTLSRLQRLGAPALLRAGLKRPFKELEGEQRRRIKWHIVGKMNEQRFSADFTPHTDF